MTRPVLKVVADPTLDGPREELRLAILDVEQAEAASAKSQAAVDLASDHLRAMKLAHGRVDVGVGRGSGWAATACRAARSCRRR